MFRSQLSRRKFVALSMGSMAAAAAARPGRLAAQVSTVRVRQPADIKSLDTARQGTYESTPLSALFCRLGYFDPWASGQTLKLDLAEELELVDPRRVRFRVKQGRFFSHGFGAVTAHDVKYSLERNKLEKVGATRASIWEHLETVELIDDYSGVIVMREPFAPIWGALGHTSAMILSKKALEATGDLYENETMPVAFSGPYIVQDYTPMTRLTLVRNPEWTGPVTPFDEFHIIPVDDDKVAEIAFDAGDLDVTEIAYSSAPRYMESPPAGSAITIKPIAGMEWVGMNVEHPKLQDLRVRRAIQLAIDVPQVLEAAYFGVVNEAVGLIAPGILGARDAKIYGKRDVETARQLVKDAGAEGRVLHIAVINSTDFVTGAQVMQSNLAEVGLKLEIDVYESGTWWSLGMEADGDEWKDLELYLARWYVNPDPVDHTMWYVPEQVGIWNWERWSNEEFGQLHEKALAMMDPAERQPIYEHMQDLMEESGAYLFLTNGVFPVVHRTDIAPAIQPGTKTMYLNEFRQA